MHFSRSFSKTFVDWITPLFVFSGQKHVGKDVFYEFDYFDDHF